VRPRISDQKTSSQGRNEGNSCQFSRDAVVEIFGGALVGVGGESAVGCPIRGGVKELDGVCYPGLSGCHPCIRAERRCQCAGGAGDRALLTDLGCHRDRFCSLSVRLRIPSRTWFEGVRGRLGWMGVK
jgi:hypothetical protein